MRKSAEELSCWIPDTFELEPTGSGVLDGKTFALKDCFAIKGHVSSFGHPTWRATHPAAKETAPVVTMLLKNGAKMAGLAKLEQLTYLMIGNASEGKPPINPLYPDRLCGGSSSGSASAVAGGLADFGIGTDTAGSMRVPVAACGLYGIRPTHSRIDNTDVIPLAPSYDTVGIVSQNAKLLSKVFSVLTPSSQDSRALQRVLLANDCLALVEPDIANAARTMAKKLADLHDLRIETINLGALGGESAKDFFVRTQPREVWQNHGQWIEQHLEQLAPLIQKRVMFAKQLSESPNVDAEKNEAWREAYVGRFEAAITPGTVVVLPVLPKLPPKRDESLEKLFEFHVSILPLTSPAGIAGAPEVVVPVQDPASGLTYGIGLLGAIGDDGLLLKVAK